MQTEPYWKQIKKRLQVLQTNRTGCESSPSKMTFLIELIKRGHKLNLTQLQFVSSFSKITWGDVLCLKGNIFFYYVHVRR